MKQIDFRVCLWEIGNDEWGIIVHFADEIYNERFYFFRELPHIVETIIQDKLRKVVNIGDD